MMKVLVKSNSKKRSGFTLLEMVLVLAIMVMMFSYLASTFKLISFSHTKVVKVNDMHDYAALNLKAIENNLNNCTSIGSGTDILSDGYYVLLNGAHIIPNYSQLTYNGAELWSTTLKFSSYPSSKTVKVEIDLKDTSNGVTYHDEMIVPCPGCEDMKLFQNASGVKISYDKKDS